MGGYGYRPDPRDERDDKHAFDNLRGLAAPPSEAALLALLTLQALRQGALGSCVAQVVSQLLHASHKQQGIHTPKLASRLAIYYLARATHRMTDWDSGTHIRAAFQVLNQFGFAPEELFPYTDSKQPDSTGKAPYQKMPPTRAFQGGFDQASKNKPTRYRRILASGQDGIKEMMRAVANGYPIAFGIDIGTDFSDRAARGEVIGAPTQVDGGHAMVAYGYQKDGDVWLVRNSWGPYFGHNGNCKLSGAYMREHARDRWTAEHAPPYSG